jgi:hypothetical protein
VQQELVRRFGTLKTITPVFPDLKVKAVWLKPRLSCQVEAGGLDANNLLKAPRFKSLITPKGPAPVRLPTEGEADPEKPNKLRAPSGGAGQANDGPSSKGAPSAVSGKGARATPPPGRP